MIGCISGIGVSAGRVGAAGAGAAGAAAGTRAGGAEATAAGAAGGTAGGDGRRARVGFVAVGLAGAAPRAPESAGLPMLEPVAGSAGGFATSAETLGDGPGAASAPVETDRVPALVSGGNTALTSFGDGAAVGSADTLRELVASGPVGRRGGRRRRGGGGLCALGGSAIRGSSPLFRHIKGIPNLGAILPSA
jgi:hypothetical protein